MIALFSACTTPTKCPEIPQEGTNVCDKFGPRVEKGLYSIPNDRYHLESFLHGYQDQMKNPKQVRVDKPFLIQKREVTVSEFQLYVEQGLSEADRQKLDTWWESSPQQPVRWVSHEMAEGYAKWLSKKTGWDLRLPSVPEWIAAVILYGESTPVLKGKEPSIELRKNVNHLLGNLREWSKDTCTTSDGEDGFKTLGENFLTGTDSENHGNAYCLSGEGGDGIGFRLIRYDIDGDNNSWK